MFFDCSLNSAAEFDCRKDINAYLRFFPARLAVVFALITSATGCSTPGLVTPHQATIDSNVSVIAFSVDASEWTEEDVWLRPNQLLLGYDDVGIPVPLDPRAGAPQRILLEIPGQEISIDWIEMDSGAGIFWKRFVSAISQSFELTSGQVNYLGRIEIDDVVFDTFDGEDRRQPVSIKLKFADALSNDLAAWQQDYKIVQEQAPNQQVVGQVTVLDYKPVWEDEFNSVKPRPGGSRNSKTRTVRRQSSQSNRSRSRPRN